MIIIELESEGENRRRRLATLKSPARRRIWLSVSLVLLLLANSYIFLQDGDLSQKMVPSLVLTCAIPFVVWFFLSTPYTSTLGSFPETHHIVAGKRVSFEYSLSADAVIENSKYGERKYPYREYIRLEKLTHGHEQIIVFAKGLIYLPQYAVKQGNIDGFTALLEQHLIASSN